MTITTIGDAVVAPSITEPDNRRPLKNLKISTPEIGGKTEPLSGRVSPSSSFTTESPHSAPTSPKADHPVHGPSELIPYHHEFLAGMFNFGKGLVELVFSIAEMVHVHHLGVDEGMPASAEIGVSSLFFISGAFNLLSGVNLFHRAYQKGYQIEIAQGISLMLQGLSDVGVGTCRLFVSIIESVHDLSEMIPEDVLAQVKVAGDALMCISLGITAFRNFYHCHQIASVSELLSGNPEEVLVKINDLRVKLADPKERLHLETILGEHCLEKLDAICYGGKLDSNGKKMALSEKDIQTLDSIKNNLNYQYRTKMLLGLMAVAASVAILVGDIFSAGIVSQVLSIMNPTLSAITLIFDGMEMIDGAKETKKIDKVDLILSAIGISIALSLGISMLVLGNVATCGGLSLGLQITSVLMPILIPLLTMAIKAAQSGQLPDLHLTQTVSNSARAVANFARSSATFVSNQAEGAGQGAYRIVGESAAYMRRQLLEMGTRLDPRNLVAVEVPADLFN
jgi:hypothetical protein